MWKIARTVPKFKSMGRVVVQCRTLKDTTKQPPYANLHRTPQTRFPDPGALPLPNNMEEINAGEKSRFSPQRARDLSGSTIASQQTGSAFGSSFMSDQTVVAGHSSGTDSSTRDDAYVDGYDQTAVLSLNSVMQSNVPKPYEPPGTKNLPTHLNMPGGNWGQDQKYLAQDLHSTHFKNISKNGVDDDENRRNFSTSTHTPAPEEGKEDRKGKLRRLIKDYGSTVVVFHVCISLLSLGGCYTAVSSGLDVVGILRSLGLSNELVESKLTSGASTFVVAYAIHKLFVPVRMSITAAATPFIVRYLRRVGILKMPPKQA